MTRLIDTVQSLEIVRLRTEDGTRVEILTLSEAAEVLGLAHATLRRQIHNGRLKAQKIGKTWIVTRAEIARYRKEHRGQGRRSDLE